MSSNQSEGLARKPISLALQGGGSHGAYTWGVLDRLLEDGRVDIGAVTATSAGAMNAVAFAYGLTIGGPEGAREKLEAFWSAVAHKGRPFNMLRNLPFGSGPFSIQSFFGALTQVASPYDLNPLNFNPLREVLEETIDFERLNTCQETRLFVSATNVSTGKIRVFKTDEIDIDTVLASACLPQVFKAVEIEDQPFWDGGYVGNPALFPLYYDDTPGDILIVHINPMIRHGAPKSADAILDRLNEITFNSSLNSELRALAFVQRLLDDGALSDDMRRRYRRLYVHAIRADRALSDLDVDTKLDTTWRFLTDLKQRGRDAADRWLVKHFDSVGERSSIDIRAEFLDPESA